MHFLPLVAWTIASCFTFECNAFEPWKIVERNPEIHDYRKLKSGYKDMDILAHVDLDFDALVNATRGLRRQLSSVDMKFLLPGVVNFSYGRQKYIWYHCKMRHNPILHPDIQARYPEVVPLTGNCGNNTVISMVYHLDDSSSVRLEVYIEGGMRLFMDNAFMPVFGSGYVYYDNYGGRLSFDEYGELLKSGRSLSGLQDSIHVTKFRLLLGITYGYTSRWLVDYPHEKPENTSMSKILTRLVSILARVNAIFLNEVGMYMEIANETDSLICKDMACGRLSEFTGLDYGFGYETGLMGLVMKGAIPGLGINVEAFDLTHGLFDQRVDFSKPRPELVDLEYKDVGTICNPIPDSFSMASSDVFDPDYRNNHVASLIHSFGHQFGATDSAQNCRLYPNDKDEMTGIQGHIEFGSGTTLMSYVTACGEDVYHSKPNSGPDFSFNSVSLAQIKKTLDWARNNNCGTTFTINKPKPLAVVSSGCRLPLASKFFLAATNVEHATRFQWDQIDEIDTRLFDKSLPKLRHYPPAKSTKRFFPSLYHLVTTWDGIPNNGETDEHEPTKPMKATMRFTARDSVEISESFDVPQAGSFVSQDIHLEWLPVSKELNVLPLFIANAGIPYVRPGDKVFLFLEAAEDIGFDRYWSPPYMGYARGTYPNRRDVDVHIAVYKKSVFYVDTFLYRYDIHEPDLNWRFAGSSKGQADEDGVYMTIPDDIDYGPEYSMMAMVSSADEKHCSAYDVIRVVDLLPPPTMSPTSHSPTTYSPTSHSPKSHSPTSNSPTSGEFTPNLNTRSPTMRPSKSPVTPRPSKSPTIYPTKRPSTARPSRAPVTSRPSKSPTAYPTKRPSTARPSKSPVTPRPSKSPTAYPTKRPSTARPSKSPVTPRPSKSPTAYPTKRPSTARPSAPTPIPTMPLTRSPNTFAI